MIGRLTRIVLAIVVLIAGYGIRDTGYALEANYVRVAVNQDAASLNVRVTGTYNLLDYDTRQVLYTGKDLRSTALASAEGILIAGKNFTTDKLYLKTDQLAEITIDGRTFRGDTLFIKKSNNRLLVVNLLDLEDYIKGILYHEASHYWPREALRAQAVVCRTYAAYQMQEAAGKDFDVTSDIYSQVYGGRTSERFRTNAVVDETRGEVLTYQGKIFPAYFHATCAGHTEDASVLWDMDIAPLQGVPCFFCGESPHFRWHYIVNLDELARVLDKAGLSVGEIKDIAVLDRDRSGRVTNVKITAVPKDRVIPAKDLRSMLGPNNLRSTNFSIEKMEGDFVFEGLGWGHGVGMCQWGAYFMAKQGYSYKRILEYYYPETKLTGLKPQ